MEPQDEYTQYERLHRDFGQTYSRVYRRVMDFYPLPQKFIQETTPEIDEYVDSLPVTGPIPDNTFNALFTFANNFKLFAAEASDVFEEYRGLEGESGKYIKDIFRLKEKGLNGDNGTAEFAKLIPVLNSLIGRYKDIEHKTEEHVAKFKYLQSEWRSFKEGGTRASDIAWPL